MTPDEIVAIYRSTYYLPDDTPLLATLGAIAANYKQDDPVWLLLVGAPGSGKTEILNGLSGLPNVHLTGNITEAGLLSGSSRKDYTDESTGGLLRVIGKFGVIIAKDFGSVLSMKHEAQAQLLAALREIFDGSWQRVLGSDGGRVLSWEGHVGFIGGCTPQVDEHHGVNASMGERFIYCRMPQVDPVVQAKQALKLGPRSTAYQDAVRSLFLDDLDFNVPLSDEEENELVTVAAFAAQARSAVLRDNYTKEVVGVPFSESPNRLARVLRNLYQGLRAIGVDQERAWQVIASIAMDCVPRVRRLILDVLMNQPEPFFMRASDIVKETKLHRNTVTRTLEDLQIHGVVVQDHDGGPWRCTLNLHSAP